MIDTIGCLLKITDAEREYIIKQLSSVSVHHDIDSDGLKETYIGYYSNLRVSLHRNSLRVKGSLAKYFQGNNLGALSRREIKEALVMLSDDLHVNIFKARLMRVDIGRCFDVDEPVSVYLDSFIDDGSFKEYCRTKNETKRFTKTNTTLLFYDKVREMAADRSDDADDEDIIPIDRRVLRYELQSQRGLANQYGYRSLKVVHLLSTRFLMKLETNWRESFFKVLRKPALGYKFGKWDYTSVCEYLMVMGIEGSNGLNAVLNRIDERYADTFTLDTDASRRRYVKNKLKRLYKKTAFAEEPELFADIEAEIRRPHFKMPE